MCFAQSAGCGHRTFLAGVLMGEIVYSYTNAVAPSVKEIPTLSCRDFFAFLGAYVYRPYFKMCLF